MAILALVQGITEFLPVSSSGHLYLTSALSGAPDQGVLFDVAVHVGTLLAVMTYFRRDLFALAAGTLDLARGHNSGQSRLFVLIVAGTLPVILVGYLLHHYRLDSAMRSIEVVAWTTLVFGIVLYVSDRIGLTVRRLEHMAALDAVLIGLAQILALIPGTSRAGITMTAGRLLGFERRDTARFSMLLSIPVIAGAGVLKGLELYELGDLTVTQDAVLGAGLAFITALAAISLLMRWLVRSTFTPFAVYRVLLGCGLLYLVYA